MEEAQRGQVKLTIGNFDELQAETLREWRERTPQERLDLFVELQKAWKPNAPGLARTFTITTIPRG